MAIDNEDKDFLYPNVLDEKSQLIASKVDFYVKRIYELHYKGLETQVRTDNEQNNLSHNSLAWPVGAIFISVSPTNPHTSLGFGTWVHFGQGRVLIGLDPTNANFDTVEETG